MRRHLWLVSIQASALLVLSSLSAGQEAKKGAAPNYYPTDVGNTWHYKVTAAGKETSIVTTIAKHEAIDGVVLARLESPKVALSEHLAQTDKGVFRHRFNGADVTPPFPLIPYPATVGARWKGDFVIEKEAGKNTYQGEIQGEEVIEVPAGKFKTLRVNLKVEDATQKVETTYWFAKDVGFVKQTFSAGGAVIVLELEKFEKKKK